MKKLILVGFFFIIFPVYATALSPEQRLGKHLYMEKSLSLNRNQSCNSCHSLKRIKGVDSNGKVVRHPSPVFARKDNILNGSIVAPGSLEDTFGSLNTPSLSYASFIPSFHWDGQLNFWVGGQFWDGRAKDLAAQAGLPILNKVEMAMPSQWAVVSRLKEKAKYRRLFLKLYNLDLNDIPSYELAPALIIPPPGVIAVFDALNQAIAAFESSAVFSPFNSKFDYVMAGMTSFTAQEQRGFELFNSTKSQCSLCHSTSMTKLPNGDEFPPLLTIFAYANIGVPENNNIPGDPIPSQGLGGRIEVTTMDPDGSEFGKHRITGLRNVALTPPYMHNGAFSSLAQVVHFYNTRDTLMSNCSDINDPGFGVSCWPLPEYAGTMNTAKVGDLGLSISEEEDIVAFMLTLTDNYPRWGNRGGLSDDNVPRGTPSPYPTPPFPEIR